MNFAMGALLVFSVGLPAANQLGGWIRKLTTWLVETVNSEPAVGTVILLPGPAKSRFDMAINYLGVSGVQSRISPDPTTGFENPVVKT